MYIVMIIIVVTNINNHNNLEDDTRMIILGMLTITVRITLRIGIIGGEGEAEAIDPTITGTSKTTPDSLKEPRIEAEVVVIAEEEISTTCQMVRDRRARGRISAEMIEINIGRRSKRRDLSKSSKRRRSIWKKRRKTNMRKLRKSRVSSRTQAVITNKTNRMQNRSMPTMRDLLSRNRSRPASGRMTSSP
jgi:hypothetical protein